jgi:hypothetical protein
LNLYRQGEYVIYSNRAGSHNFQEERQQEENRSEAFLTLSGVNNGSSNL